MDKKAEYKPVVEPIFAEGELFSLIGSIRGGKAFIRVIDEGGSEIYPDTRVNLKSDMARRRIARDICETFKSLGFSDIDRDSVFAAINSIANKLNKQVSQNYMNNHPEYKENNNEISDEERAEAIALLKDPAFFYKLGKLLEKGWVVKKVNKPRFVLGEERKKRLLPILISGVPLGYTSLIRVIGEPGTAKDSMIRLAVELLPFKIEERGYITPASLRYSQDVEILYIPDSEQLKGEIGRHLRLMRSDDGGLVAEYAIKDKETGEMTTKIVETTIKGIVTSSNEIGVDPALASGMWTLTTNADPELTKRVKEEKLKLHAGERELIDPEELKVWKNAFKIAVEDNEEIIIPYAPYLLKILDSKKSASRRDPDKLCELIKLIAKFRRFQKPEEERNKADVVDLYIALQLGWNAIAETISELNRTERRIYDLVRELNKATVREIADRTKLGYTTCYEILEGLVRRGYLNKDKEGRANIYTVLVELENGELSGTFAERNPTPDSLVELISTLLPNFQTFGEMAVDVIVDPVHGTPLRKLERSKQRMNHEDPEGKDITELSPKVSENLNESTDENEQNIDKTVQAAKLGIHLVDGLTWHPWRGGARVRQDTLLRELRHLCEQEGAEPETLMHLLKSAGLREIGAWFEAPEGVETLKRRLSLKEADRDDELAEGSA